MKVWTISLGFVPARIWRQSLEAYHRTRNPALEYTHVFVDQHYPLNREQNALGLKQVCDDHGILFLDPGENLGLHGGFNWALKQIQARDGDLVIGYDPDSHPITPGWDMALVNSLEICPDLAWVTLMSQRAREDILPKGYITRKAHHIELWEMRHAVINSICAWRVDFLNRAGGLQEPMKYYGHLESRMWQELQKQGKKWAFLPGYWEDYRLWPLHDQEYIRWKWYYAHRKLFEYGFDEYVRRGCFVIPEEPIGKLP